MFKKLMHKLFSEKGQSLVETALIIALVSIVAIGALTATGTSVNSLFGNIAEQFGGDNLQKLNAYCTPSETAGKIKVVIESVNDPADRNYKFYMFVAENVADLPVVSIGETLSDDLIGKKGIRTYNAVIETQPGSGWIGNNKYILLVETDSNTVIMETVIFPVCEAT